VLPSDDAVADGEGEPVAWVETGAEVAVDAWVAVLLPKPLTEEVAKSLVVEVESEVEVETTVVVFAVVTCTEVETDVEATTVEVLTGWPPG